MAEKDYPGDSCNITNLDVPQGEEIEERRTANIDIKVMSRRDSHTG
jgi:hypothetical protein